MRRISSGGLEREQLVSALKSTSFVRRARRKDQCVLCCSPRVNAAGLCEACCANLTDSELDAALPWIEGTRV